MSLLMTISSLCLIQLLLLLLLLLLQAFIKRHISGTSPFIGAYTHYSKMYIESYESFEIVKSNLKTHLLRPNL